MPDDHCELSVRVTPRSSQNKIEASADGVKVWVTAAPTDGQANKAVCRLIAKTLKVAPSKVSVLRGEISRDKVLRIEGMTLEHVMTVLTRGPS